MVSIYVGRGVLKSLGEVINEMLKLGLELSEVRFVVP
jgi:hypothetical protein